MTRAAPNAGEHRAHHNDNCVTRAIPIPRPCLKRIIVRRAERCQAGPGPTTGIHELKQAKRSHYDEKSRMGALGQCA